MAHDVTEEGGHQGSVDSAPLEEEIASLRDRLLRALADAENTRRYAKRQVEDARKFAISSFARELLGVVDNLQRTLDAADLEKSETSRDGPLIEGVRATQRHLEQVLDRFGIHKVASLGERFDPNLHEAMMAIDDPSHPPGTVVYVAEEGYLIHGRLLRPAKVSVVRP